MAIVFYVNTATNESGPVTVEDGSTIGAFLNARAIDLETNNVLLSSGMTGRKITSADLEFALTPNARLSVSPAKITGNAPQVFYTNTATNFSGYVDIQAGETLRQFLARQGVDTNTVNVLFNSTKLDAGDAKWDAVLMDGARISASPAKITGSAVLA